MILEGFSSTNRLIINVLGISALLAPMGFELLYELNKGRNYVGLQKENVVMIILAVASIILVILNFF